MAPQVRILMGTYNGAAWLGPQLASFADQSHGDWSLWTADDGSTDATRACLVGFAAAHPGREIRQFDGPGRGAAQNFLGLLARPGPGDGYTAFSDQDDVWMPDKLERALAALGAGDPGRPAVYASASYLTGPELEDPRPSPPMRRPPSFGNALVQNVLAGNTIVLNPAAARIARAAAPAAQAAGVPFHDWWLYQLMTGIGARIHADPAPGLYYRQHAENLLGENRSRKARTRRSLMALNGDYAGWIDRNLAALTPEVPLTPENRARIDGFARLRRRPGPTAAAELKRLGIRRQSRSGTLAIQALAMTGRL